MQLIQDLIKVYTKILALSLILYLCNRLPVRLKNDNLHISNIGVQSAKEKQTVGKFLGSEKEIKNTLHI